MAVSVHDAGSEDEATPELKGIPPQLMLAVAGGTGAVAGGFVVAPQHVQKVRVAETGGAVRLALLVDQQRERDARILPEQVRA